MLNPRFALPLVASLISGAALAHDHATGIIAERMAAMTNMGRELKSIGTLLVRGPHLDATALAPHAKALREAARQTHSMFPPGSLDHHSFARPSIWEQPEAFRLEAQRLQDASEKLAAGVEGSDKVAKLLASYEDIRASCNSCHDKFRIPED